MKDRDNAVIDMKQGSDGKYMSWNEWVVESLSEALLSDTPEKRKERLLAMSSYEAGQIMLKKILDKSPELEEFCKNTPELKVHLFMLDILNPIKENEVEMSEVPEVRGPNDNDEYIQLKKDGEKGNKDVKIQAGKEKNKENNEQKETEMPNREDKGNEEITSTREKDDKSQSELITISKDELYEVINIAVAQTLEAYKRYEQEKSLTYKLKGFSKENGKKIANFLREKFNRSRNFTKEQLDKLVAVGKVPVNFGSKVFRTISEKVRDFKDKTINYKNSIVNKGREIMENIDEYARINQKLNERSSTYVGYKDAKGNMFELHELIPDDKQKEGKEYIIAMYGADGSKNFYEFYTGRAADISKEQLFNFITEDKKNLEALREPGAYVARDHEGKMAVFTDRGIIKEQQSPQKFSSIQKIQNTARYGVHKLSNAIKSKIHNMKNKEEEIIHSR